MKKRLFSVVQWGALLLGASSMLSRLLGVVRDYVFSKIFGVELDAYYLAFRIPDLLYTLLIMGALSSAFIPLYTRLRKQSDEEGDFFASQILSMTSFLLLLLSGLVFVFVPWVLPLLAPGFDSETLRIAIDLTRIMLLSPIFMGLSGILQGIENVHKKFLGMALAPIFYNLSIIGAALLFGSSYGMYALAWGVAVGAFLHFLIQIPGALASAFRFHWIKPRSTPALKEFFTLALPRILGISAAQFTLVVDFALASLLPLGAVSIYSYSLNLQSFPYGVVAVSFSIAVFSTLAEQALNKDKTEFTRTLKESFQSIWFWAFPAVVGLFLLREPLIALILKGGSFDESAALLTEQTFAILIWSALPQSLIPLWSRAFYSLSNTRTPVIIAVVTMFLNVVLSVLFVYVLGWPVYALALSNLLAALFNAGLLLIYLRRDLNTSLNRLIDGSALFKSIMACGLMTLVLLYFPDFHYPHVFLELITLSLIGFLVYFFVSKVSQRS